MSKPRNGPSVGGFRSLPEGIMQCILSFLNYKDARRAMCLSKEWLEAFKTYPELEFNLDDFFRPMNTERLIQSDTEKRRVSMFEARSLFRKNIDNFLLRRSLPLRLKLSTDFFPEEGDAAFLDKWLKLAVENGVRKLEISLRSPGYVVPECILESESLTELYLHNCKLSEELKLQSWCNNIHTLDLRSISFDFDMFAAMIAGCPSIERLVICNSRAISKPKTDAKHHQTVDELKAKCQPSFLDESAKGPFRNLQNITMSCTVVTEAIFDDLLNKIPHLRSLSVSLSGSNGHVRIRIRNSSLINLELAFINDMSKPKLEINAPNLTSFHLDASYCMPKKLSFAAISPRMKSKISILAPCYMFNYGFTRLNNMLINLYPSKVSLEFALPSRLDCGDCKYLGRFFSVDSIETIMPHLDKDDNHFRLVSYIIENVAKMRKQDLMKEIEKYDFLKDETKKKRMKWKSLSDFVGHDRNGNETIVFYLR